MLSLESRFEVGDFALFRDRAGRGDDGWTSRFYAVRTSPRLATSGGKPDLHFTWYRRPAGSEGHGGMLVLTTELGPTPEERGELTTEIEARFEDELPGPVQLLDVPFLDGSVRLSVGGEPTTGEAGTADFVVGGASPAPATLGGGQRVSFAAELTADGAALLWQTLEREESVVHVQYELLLEHLPGDVELRVWCDAERSHEALAAEPGRGVDLLVERKLAGVRVDAGRVLPAEDLAALTAQGHDVLRRALQSAFFGGVGDGEAPALEPWSSRIGARLDYVFSQSIPLTETIAIGGALQLPPPEGLDEHVERVDLEPGFFDVLDVAVLTTADFTDSPIDKIRVAIDYDETTPDGERIARRGDFLLTEASPSATFHTDLAAPDLRSVRYRAEVYYDAPGVEPLVLEEAVTTTVIVLDVDGVGAIDLSGELGHAPPEQVTHATVELETVDGSHTHKVLLDAGSPSFRWLEATGRSDERLRHRVTWHAPDGTHRESPWLEVETRRLRFDAPEAWVRRGRVKLLSSGLFDGLAQIVVDLETLTEPSGETAQFAFTEPGQETDWSPASTEEGELRYRYRTTLGFENGERLELPWSESDRQVLAVHDSLRREVAISARLLDLGGEVRLATVRLEGPGASPRTFVLREPDDRPVWSYRPAPGADPSYSYRLTLIPRSGDRVETPWLTAQDELLLLRQPPTE